MSTQTTTPDTPRVRVGAVSTAVAGGRSVRLGAVFLTGQGHHHDLTVRTLARATKCMGSGSGPAIFRRAGSLWELGFGGTVVHMPDLKGLGDLATLLASPGREMHALELSGAPASGPRDAGTSGSLDGLAGDLGDVIDAPARAAYRARVDELLDEIEDARRTHDPVRAEHAQLELAAIREQLEAAYGLGGRIRRSGDPAERARTTVTARIRAAVRRIETVNPALGLHLRNSVRTGTWCVYEPEMPVTWQL
jgi:hypothetical protein